MEIKRTRIILGDIFEVKIEDNSKKYFQYIADDYTQLNSCVIRVFNETYRLEEMPTLDQITHGKVEFYSHTIIRLGIKNGAWKKVGNSKNVGIVDNIKFFSADKESFKWYFWKINKIMKHRSSLPSSYSGASIGFVFSPKSLVKMMTYGQFSIHPSFWSLPEKKKSRHLRYLILTVENKTLIVFKTLVRLPSILLRRCFPCRPRTFGRGIRW